ncbi:GNAT family N-acetyltransferase [Haliea sp. E17]|uniref:GNAT family N-acetyltransferase n=1 Tax=Haliea sp. E17 TaxID=3401576 RepID=UPI003AAC62D8
MSESLCSKSDVETSEFRVVNLSELTDRTALPEQWSELLTRATNRNFLQDTPWAEAVSNILLPGKLNYYAVYNDMRIVAIVPLQKVSSGIWPFELRYLLLPTHTDIYLNDIVIDQDYIDKPILWEILKHIRTNEGFRWDYCRLRKFCRFTALHTQLARTGAKLRRVGDYAYAPCNDAQDYDSYSTKMLKNVRRLANKAAREIGPIEVSCSEDPASREAFYQDFLDIESSGWKGPTGSDTSVMSSAVASAFFRSLYTSDRASWHARVFLLKFGDKKAASLLTIKTGTVWFVLKTGYEEQYRDYGPGNILLHKFIAEAVDEPEVEKINLTTSPLWADRWHFQREPVYETILYSKSLAALVSRMYFSTRNFVSPVVRYWRARNGALRPWIQG